MAFNVLSLRNVGDDAGSALYPELAAEPGAVAVDSLDGDHVEWFKAKNLTVFDDSSGELIQMHLLAEKDIDVFVTDARIGVVCRKFEKGRTWLGLGGAGLAAATLLTTVSHARSAARRRGKAMVGHVRYAWLSAVEARSQDDRGRGAEVLRLRLTDTTTSAASRSVVVDIHLARGTQAAELARRVAIRAARYRLAHTSADDPHRALLEQAASSTIAQPETIADAVHGLPGAAGASAETAYPSGFAELQRPASTSTPSTYRGAASSSGVRTVAPVERRERRCVRSGCSGYFNPIYERTCPTCEGTTQLISM